MPDQVRHDGWLWSLVVVIANRDHFWLSASAWRFSIAESLRSALGVGIVIFIVRSLGWLFCTDNDLREWLSDSGKVALFVALPMFVIFAISTRWALWISNRVKPKK